MIAKANFMSPGATLWREVDALGGTGLSSEGESWSRGYSEALSDVLAIIERRGFSEKADATLIPMCSTCEGTGSVGYAPDDYSSCPECNKPDVAKAGDTSVCVQFDADAGSAGNATRAGSSNVQPAPINFPRQRIRPSIPDLAGGRFVGG